MKPLLRLRGRLAGTVAAMSTRAQLLAAFATVLVLTAAVGAVGLIGLQRVDAQADALSNKWLPGVGHVASAKAAVLDARDHEVKHSRSTDKSYHAEYEAKITDASKLVEAALADYDKLVTDETERKLHGTWSKTWAEYQKAQRKVIALGRDGKQQDAADISDGMSSTAATKC